METQRPVVFKTAGCSRSAAHWAKRIFAIGLFFVLLAATHRVWLPTGVFFSADIETEKAFTAQAFFCGRPGEEFGRDKAVSATVKKGRSRIGILIPEERLSRFRFDCGQNPGTVRLSNIRLSGDRTVGLDAGDFSFSPDVESHSTGEDGALRLFSGKVDPYIVCNRELDIRGAIPQWEFLRREFPLVFLWILALFLVARSATGTGAAVWRNFADGWRTGAIAPGGDGRIVSFDCIRILAFLFVVASHLLVRVDATGIPVRWNAHGTCWGQLGVGFFFMLSGASLSIGSLREGVRFRDFYRKRLAAILPPFWVAYAVCLLFRFAHDGQMTVDRDWLAAVPSVFGMDGYLSRQHGTCYLVGEWYIGCLLLLYLLAPTVERLVRRWPVRALGGLYALSVASLLLTPVLAEAVPFWNPNPRFNPLSHVFDFAFGMAFFRFIRPNFKRYAVAAGLSLAVVVPCLLFAPTPLFNCDAAGIPLMAAAFVLFCFGFDLLSFGPETRRAIRFLGTGTYLAFLFHHRLVLQFTRAGEPMDNLRFAYAMALTVAVSFGLAHCCRKPAAALGQIVFGGKSRNGR
jgi:peptidoglycan/LPS O-acetylase OafA/YrhL